MMDRRRRRQWTEHDARAVLDEFAASHESATEFARRKGVSWQRIAYWRKRLAAATPGFVSVAMSASVPSARLQIEFLARGVIVRVREDIDVEKLAAIVAVLADDKATC